MKSVVPRSSGGTKAESARNDHAATRDCTQNTQMYVPVRVICKRTRRCSLSATLRVHVGARRYAHTNGRGERHTSLQRNAHTCLHGAFWRRGGLRFALFAFIRRAERGRRNETGICAALQAVEKGWWAEGCLINCSDKRA